MNRMEWLKLLLGCLQAIFSRDPLAISPSSAVTKVTAVKKAGKRAGPGKK